MKATFNAVNWISQNYANVYIDEPSQVAIVNFSLMWNVFEGQFCNNNRNAMIDKLDSIAEEVADVELPEKEIKKVFEFYKNRYVENGATNERFNNLNFRRNDRREFVEEVIVNNEDITKDSILALLIIVYRIRNNLFHGTKSFRLIHDQAKNLNSASECLSLMMECLKNRRGIEY